MLLVALSLVIGSVAIAYFFIRRNLNYFKRHNVPHFEANPFFGHFKDFMTLKTSPYENIMNIYNHEKLKNEPYGGIFVFQTPGLLIKDTELIKKMLMKDAHKFMDRFAQADDHGDPLGRSNLFLAKGERWKQIRSKMVHAFTSAKVKNMFSHIHQVGKELDIHLNSMPLEKGNSFCKEVKSICSSYVMDVIATTAFGLVANTLNNPDSPFVKYGSSIFDFNFKRAIEFNSIMLWPNIVSIIRAKALGKKGGKFLEDLARYAIDERIKSGVIRNDIIDVLVDLKKGNLAESKFQFSDDVLHAQVGTFFSAGFETTSQSMAFILYELAKNPEVQDKLRSEIKSVLQKYQGNLTYDSLNEMEYMGMVIKEGLRLYPVFAYIERRATFANKNETYSLEPFGSFKIPHGMPIFIPAYAIQRDPQYFPDPNRFDPERFSSENKNSIKSGTYLAFGCGPRVCIGERQAWSSVRVGLTYFLKNHFVRLGEKSMKEMEFSNSAFLTQAKDGIFLDIVRDPMEI